MADLIVEENETRVCCMQLEVRARAVCSHKACAPNQSECEIYTSNFINEVNGFVFSAFSGRSTRPWMPFHSLCSLKQGNVEHFINPHPYYDGVNVSNILNRPRVKICEVGLFSTCLAMLKALIEVSRSVSQIYE